MHRPVARIAFTITQLGIERNASAKAIERQIAVVLVVTVEIGPFLIAVKRVVGGIEVENDFLRVFREGLNAELDEGGFECCTVWFGLNLVVVGRDVAVLRLGVGRFEPIER